MQQPSWKWVKVGILLGVLGLCLVLAPIGCSSEPEYPDIDPCDGPGWPSCQATMVASMPDFEPVLATDEQTPTAPDVGIAPDVGMVGIQNGVRFALDYDSTANAFTGVVENITGNTLSSITIEVRLDGSDDRGAQVTVVDLAPSQVSEVTLPVGSDPFTTWSGHLTIR